MKNLVFFRGSTGLNNLVDPIRVGLNEDTGISDLAEAFNVDIDDSGRVSRCKGFTATGRTESTHSMFALKQMCLYVSGTALFRLFPDYSRLGIRSGLTPDAYMDYAMVNENVYYLNGHESGVVKDNISYAWTAGEYYGVTTFRQFSNPPIGHLICYSNGRMYIAENNVIWFSEPWAYGSYDMTRNYFLFPSRVVSMKAVSGGLYVSDESKTYFIGIKDNPADAILDEVYSYPIIAGSAVIGDAIQMGFKDSYGPVMLCATDRGICVGFAGGKFENLTLHKLVYPSANRATATIKDGTYICLLQE